MAQEFSTPPSYEPPKKRSNTTIIVVILLVLLLCCCGFIAVMYFYLGDVILNIIEDMGVGFSHLISNFV